MKSSFIDKQAALISGGLWVDKVELTMVDFAWAKLSNKITIKLLTALNEQNISKHELAVKSKIRVNVLSLMFRGDYNFSLKEIAILNKTLNIELI